MRISELTIVNIIILILAIYMIAFGSAAKAEEIMCQCVQDTPQPLENYHAMPSEDMDRILEAFALCLQTRPELEPKFKSLFKGFSKGKGYFYQDAYGCGCDGYDGEVAFFLPEMGAAIDAFLEECLK